MIPDSIALIIAGLAGAFIGSLIRGFRLRAREHRAWIAGYKDCCLFNSRKEDPDARRI